MKTDNSLWSKRFASCRNRNAALFALLFAMFAVTTYALPVAAAENNWWRTPAQQAQDAFKNNDFERLESIAPNVDWQGIAQHKAGDYEAAQETFNDQLDRAQQSDDFDAVNRALYNRSVNEARSGQFEQARNTLDEVLQSDPEFADAQHNREIVEQLIELQETPPEQNQQGEGKDDGEPSESQDGEQSQSSESGEGGESSSDQPSEGQSQSDEQADEQDAEQQGQPDASQVDDAAQSQSATEQEEAQQAASEALAAEAEAQAEDNTDSDPGNEELDESERSLNGARETDEPLSESEQAMEQWLRRIPDNPEGLLRRKLEQSHRTEYPEVGNARNPW